MTVFVILVAAFVLGNVLSMGLVMALVMNEKFSLWYTKKIMKMSQKIVADLEDEVEL